MKNFPDWFFDKTDWQEKFVGDVCKIQTGTGNKQDKIDDGIYNFYVRSKKIEHSNKYIFDGEAVLTAGDGDIGKIFHYVDGKFNCHQRVYFLTDFKEVLGKYFYYYFSTKFYERVRKLSAKNTVDSVRMNMISEMKIKFPPLAVQKKIAEYFTSLDNAINAQDLKLKSWRDAKKAMLQKIFAQEFYFTQDNGEKYPAWQEKNLGEIAEKIIGGGTPDTANRNFYAGNVTWISSSDLKENDVHKISKTRFITEDAIKNSATKKIPPKSILIVTRVGVGKVALSDEILCTSQDFTNLILKENFLSEFFVYQIAIKMKIAAQQTQGTAIKGITTDEVKKIKIKIPCLEEQKKIAEYFSSLDKIIDAENKILENLQQMKRGLLQKLFV